jgi:hypothetical protein
MSPTKQERAVLQELGKRVAEIAALPAQQETIALWKANNDLHPVRPMVTIDQVCWNEMDVDGELTLQTTDPFCQELEGQLRRTLYAWKHMRVDMVVEPVIDVYKVINSTGFGVSAEEDILKLDPTNAVVSHHYHDRLKTEEDLARMHAPELSLDVVATAKREQMAHELLDGAIGVRMQGMFPMFAPWDALSTWRGVEAINWDLADRPDFMHRTIGKLTDYYMIMLDQMEAKALLGWGQPLIHCTGAWTDQLPAPGANPAKPRAKDIWTCGMAQMFSTVSPAMQKEYDLDYAERWYQRFGMVYYGCCEPLDRKIDIIRKIPHVRKVSMSPWVDVNRGAEKLAPDLVFSRKPNPALLAWDHWNPGNVEEHLRETREACKRYGCALEYILKDISTVRYQPQRLWEWADIAMRVAKS